MFYLTVHGLSFAFSPDCVYSGTGSHVLLAPLYLMVVAASNLVAS